jgi:hypothetical protein
VLFRSPRISGSTAIPAVIGWFPKEKLAGSARLVPESVLGLRILKRGYVSQYDFGKGFLVSESSSEVASQIMGKLRDRIGQTAPAKIGDEAFTGTDKYLDGVCVFRKGKVLAGFSNLKPSRDVMAEATSFANQIP